MPVLCARDPSWVSAHSVQALYQLRHIPRFFLNWNWSTVCRTYLGSTSEFFLSDWTEWRKSSAVDDTDFSPFYTLTEEHACSQQWDSSISTLNMSAPKAPGLNQHTQHRSLFTTHRGSPPWCLRTFSFASVSTYLSKGTQCIIFGIFILLKSDLRSSFILVPDSNVPYTLVGDEKFLFVLSNR